MNIEGFGLGIKHQIFNNEVRKRREELNLTQKQLSILAGLTTQVVGALETFKRFPSESEAEAIADILNTSAKVLFPKWLEIYVPKTTTKVTEIKITETQLTDGTVQHLLGDGADELEDDLDHGMLKEELDKQLNSLSERERKVLIMRFGFDDGKSKDLETVGRAFNVTRERIRQIEAKAIRKLRHPTRASNLREYDNPAWLQSKEYKKNKADQLRKTSRYKNSIV